MLGSTIISEKDRTRLSAFTPLENIDDFVHIDLEAMTTLDFEMLATSANIDWAEGQPVQFDPAGLCIFKISEVGISYLLSHIVDVPEEYQDDVQKLAEFVAKNGKSHLYELATF